MTVNLSTGGNKAHQQMKDSLAALTGRQAYVGIPATTAEARLQQILAMAAKSKGKRRTKHLRKAAVVMTINNAELLYIHTNGSSLRHIPARPVIQPAIEDPENRVQILAELELAAKAAFEGKPEVVERQLKLAGTVAANAAKAWFTNSKNHWAPNAPSTIRRKGSSRPLIDTDALRQAITSIVDKAS